MVRSAWRICAALSSVFAYCKADGFRGILLSNGFSSAAYQGGESDQRVKYDKEFDDKFQLLADILTENQEKVKKIKTLVQEIQAIKLSKPQGSKPGADSPELKKALQEAKDAAKKYGDGSKEAVQAWMTVEEIASADQSEATSGDLDDECLIQTIEAVGALLLLE